jgi:Subtilase family
MRWAAGLAVPGVPANPTPARIINMSLGSDGACTSAYADAVTAVTATGAAIVVAAGNNAGHAVGTPGNCAGVIAVAGLRHVGTKVGFSAVGTEVALSAPGGNCVNITAGSPCLYPMLTTSNSGTTVPADSIYTDSFNVSLGTSFSTPLVAATAGLMLSVQPTLTPHQIRLMLEATTRPFPATSSDATPDAPVVQCTAPQTDSAGNPVDQLECVCTIDTCGAGMLNAGAAVQAATVAGTPAATVQGDGLWWNAPAGSESGWGINFAHQGNVLFATWFTYDLTGKAWWLSMTANNSAADSNTYSGQLLATHGPAFSAAPFNPSLVTRTTVGSGTINFADVNRASFAYTVNGVQQTKSITRQAFATPPTCSFLPAPNFAAASNYQDLWWVAGGAE